MAKKKTKKKPTKRKRAKAKKTKRPGMRGIVARGALRKEYKAAQSKYRSLGRALRKANGG